MIDNQSVELWSLLGAFSRSRPVGGRSFQVVSCCKKKRLGSAWKFTKTPSTTSERSTEDRKLLLLQVSFKMCISTQSTRLHAVVLHIATVKLPKVVLQYLKSRVLGQTVFNGARLRSEISFTVNTDWPTCTWLHWTINFKSDRRHVTNHRQVWSRFIYKVCSSN